MKKLQPYSLFYRAKTFYPVSEDSLREVLSEVPRLIGMRKLGEPLIMEGTKLKGFSGVQMIEESHISLHCFDQTGEIWFFILSCKQFKHKKVVDYLKDKLDIERNILITSL